MKKAVFLLVVTLFSYCFTYSQNLKDAGAGVIDFLLRNPKTANRMNSSEAVALDIIGNLLTTSSEREHELKYAEARSNKIIINSNDNRHAEIVKDTNGRIYLLVDGTIYPISEELIKQAQSSRQLSASPANVTNEFLPPYDINELKGLVKKNSNNNDEICAVFTCNKIVHNKSHVNFNKDFQNIKRRFYQNEDLYVVVRYNTHKNKNYYSSLLVIRIYDSYNKLILERTTQTTPNKNYYNWWSLLNFSPGVYTIHTFLCNNSNEYVPIGLKYKTEKMEIIKN